MPSGWRRQPDRRRRRSRRHAAELYEREIVLEPYTVASGQFRLAELADPSGNTVTFAQTADADAPG